jgi:hypothetical protein
MRTRDHRTSSPARAGAALTALAAIAVVAGCARAVSAPGAGAIGPSPSPVIGDGTPSSTPARPRATDPTEPSSTPRPTIPVAPAPEWTVDLAGQLQCDGPIPRLGGEVPDGQEIEALGPTAQDALEVFLGPSNPYASLPTTGFVSRHVDPHWVDFGYAVGGRTKTIIVLSDTSIYGPGWTVMGLRSCDASEFGPTTPLTFPVTIWTDSNGDRVSTETIRSHPGPAHCGHEDAIWLTVDGQLFFRDPKHVMADWERSRFDADVTLPSRARDTGYRNGDLALWIDPKGDAYVVGPSRTERWPRSTDPQLGCA